MKLSLKFNGQPQLIVRYENNEWETIRKKLESLNLKIHKTQNLWGQGEEAMFYREEKKELMKYLMDMWNEKCKSIINQFHYTMIDDINRPFFEKYTFNIALFRIIPNEDNKVVINLPRLLTVIEIQFFTKILGVVLKTLLDMILEAEIEMKIKMKGGE